ncbi:MAG: DHH family phosphoesterase, partial [Candidatus Woesearchaeota archaeon]
LNWYESNVKNIDLNFDFNDKNIKEYILKNDVVKTDKFIIINAKNNILPSIIGTIASIISNTDIKPGTLILALAYDNDKIKASLRIKEDKKLKENKLTENSLTENSLIEKLTNDNYNLKEFITKISEKVNCQAGGHKNAAGAIISKENEELFIREFIRLALN